MDFLIYNYTQSQCSISQTVISLALTDTTSQWRAASSAQRPSHFSACQPGISTTASAADCNPPYSHPQITQQPLHLPISHCPPSTSPLWPTSPSSIPCCITWPASSAGAAPGWEDRAAARCQHSSLTGVLLVGFPVVFHVSTPTITVARQSPAVTGGHKAKSILATICLWLPTLNWRLRPSVFTHSFYSLWFSKEGHLLPPLERLTSGRNHTFRAPQCFLSWHKSPLISLTV